MMAIKQEAAQSNYRAQCYETFSVRNLRTLWKELNKCLDEDSSNVWSTDINLMTSTLSSCTCSFEGQATLNEYL